MKRFLVYCLFLGNLSAQSMGDALQLQVKVCEWLIDVRFTAAEREHLMRLSLEEAQRDPATVNNLSSHFAFWEEIQRQSPARREFNRQILYSMQIPRWKDRPGALYRWLYDSAMRHEAAGPEPPLERAASDAYVDLIWWAAAQTQQRAPIVPSAAFRELWFAKLQGEYPRFPALQKRQIAKLPLFRQGLTETWPGAFPEARAVILAALQPAVDLLRTPARLDPELARETQRLLAQLSAQPDTHLARLQEEEAINATRRQLDQLAVARGQAAMAEAARFRAHMDSSFSRCLDLLTWPGLSEDEKRWRRSQGRSPY